MRLEGWPRIQSLLRSFETRPPAAPQDEAGGWSGLDWRFHLQPKRAKNMPGDGPNVPAAEIVKYLTKMGNFSLKA
jgi:hypothetical protein